MKCPQCNAWTIVRETRRRKDGTKRRTYECANLHTFCTVERVEVPLGSGRRKKVEA